MGEVPEKVRYSLKGVEIRYIHPKESGRFRSVVVITSPHTRKVAGSSPAGNILRPYVKYLFFMNFY